MAHGGAPRVLSPTELRDELASPFALEDIGLADAPVLACAVPGSLAAGHELDDLRSRLRSVRAVTIGVTDETLGLTAAELAADFDIVLAPPASAGEALVPVTDVAGEISAITDAVRANPQAAVALVELLRLGAYTSVPQGLVAESLTFSTLQGGTEFGGWLAARGPASVPPDPEEPVLMARVGTSLEITLNRPHRANAFTAAVRDGLVAALRLADADPTIEGIVLRGAGESFSSGGDLAEFGSSPDPATGHATRVLRSPAWWVAHLARDTRVELHGACVGAGIEVPAFAGTVIAAADTRIRLPEVAMGLVPGAGGTVSLPRRIGPHRTAYLAVTGAELDARTALAWGLVDRLA